MKQTIAKKEGIWDFQATGAVEAVERLLDRASSMNASDIHIDPGIKGLTIRMRIDGQLEAVGVLPKKLHEEIIARLKILAGARTDLHSVPQDGRFRIDLMDKPYNIRASFMPTYHGENVVVRLLPSSFAAGDSFASLGFTPEHVHMCSQALKASNGLILVTGPTGSGKTTTLRVFLGLKAAEQLSVMTLEDPVEYEVPGVRHVHVRHSHGVTFASGLRAALRQDPDVIMVGEMRDNETALTAVNTALTGHLVLSTLHTTSAIDSILRMSQMGIAGYLTAATVRLLINQRLVRVICGECGGEGDKCPVCRGTGFFGRSVIAEVLAIDDAIRDMISAGADTKTIREYASTHGFQPMELDAAEKVDWGVTTREEVARALNA